MACFPKWLVQKSVSSQILVSSADFAPAFDNDGCEDLAMCNRRMWKDDMNRMNGCSWIMEAYRKSKDPFAALHHSLLVPLYTCIPLPPVKHTAFPQLPMQLLCRALLRCMRLKNLFINSPRHLWEVTQRLRITPTGRESRHLLTRAKIIRRPTWIWLGALVWHCKASRTARLEREFELDECPFY